MLSHVSSHIVVKMHFCYFLSHRLLNTDESTVKEQLKILYEQSLIKEMEPGKWVRNVLDQKTGWQLLSFLLHYVTLRSILCPAYELDQPGITNVTKRIN